MDAIQKKKRKKELKKVLEANFHPNQYPGRDPHHVILKYHSKIFQIFQGKKSFWILGESDEFHQKPYTPWCVPALITTQNTFVRIHISSLEQTFSSGYRPGQTSCIFPLEEHYLFSHPVKPLRLHHTADRSLKKGLHFISQGKACSLQRKKSIPVICTYV